jgi:hypothetical protein
MFDFPMTPIIGQTFPIPPIIGQPIYIWDGEKWNASLPTTSVSGVSQSYVDTQDALRVLKIGDTMTGPLSLPASAPVAENAVRKDYVDAAIGARLPIAATPAEFAANSAPTKMLAPSSVWGVSTVSVPYNAAINLAAGFDFIIPGGPLHNPINAKQGQKGTVLIQGAITGWGTSWKFPNVARPAWSGGNDLLSYSVYTSDYIWCVYLSNMG